MAVDAEVLPRHDDLLARIAVARGDGLVAVQDLGQGLAHEHGRDEHVADDARDLVLQLEQLREEQEGERLPLAHVHDLHLVAQRRAEGDAVVIELVHVEHGVHQRLLAADVGAHLLGGLPVDVDLLAQDLADLFDLGGKQDAVGFHDHCSPFA